MTLYRIEIMEVKAEEDIYSLISSSNNPDMLDVLQLVRIFSRYNAIADLAQAPAAEPLIRRVSLDNPEQSTFLYVLIYLCEVGADIDRYQQSTNQVNQSATLAQAADKLRHASFAVEIVGPSDQGVLMPILKKWKALIIEAGGDQIRGVEVRGPVANSYVIGNPVRGSLFMGRDDILRRLDELWLAKANTPSVVLNGQRRMGKTSITLLLFWDW